MPEGMEAQPAQIVPYEGGARPRTASPRGGLVWCACGALVATIAPPLAAYFAALGCAMLSAMGDRAMRASFAPSVLCVVGLLLGAAPADVLMGLSAYVAGCLFGYAIARRGTSVTTELLLTMGFTVALVAVDAWRAHGAGTTIEAVLGQEIDMMVGLYAEQMDIAAGAALDRARELVMLLWPMSYFLIAAVSAACAHLGARAGLKRVGADSPRLPLAFLDTPLWVVGVMAASIVLVAVGGLLGERGTLLLTAGLNALAVVRIVLALDGMGVIAFFLTRMGTGGLVRLIVLVIAVNVEISLPIVSGFGLVDFWANFRRLARGVVPADGPQG